MCPYPGLAKGFCFGVRASASLRMTCRGDTAFAVQYDAADCGVGPHLPQSPFRQAQGVRHMARVCAGIRARQGSSISRRVAQGPVCAAYLFQYGLKIAGLTEVLIHARKAYIGNRIEI